MRLLDLAGASWREIDRFGSQGARHHAFASLADGAVAIIHLSPGGLLGRHPAAGPQLFVVVAGSGWVAGPDGERAPVAEGDAVLWDAGEEHESGTDTGLTAMVFEARSLKPR